RDRLHPTKRLRPIAQGSVSPTAALWAAGVCVAASTFLAAVVSYREPYSTARAFFWVAAAAYLLLNLGYSLGLKDRVILDVLLIALGFVLRVVAGCLAIPVDISPWLLVCTLLLALLLGLCKRRHEMALLENGNHHTRRVLPHYTPELLNQMISETTAAVLVSYMLYTFQPHLGRPNTDPRMMLTIPFVIYGVWRYQYLAYRHDMGGSPERAFRDRLFLLNGAMWVALVLLLTYWH
ncbi:MAG: UbiA family prenyltransferase, partial [Armatimonadota bacterium]|nr:UbiA family prenyltransferase [Armatimonadota bacterium]